MDTLFDPQIETAEQFAEALTEKFKGENEFTPKVFYVKPGQKYDRVMQQAPSGTAHSIHCFVEKATGHVYKAAGLKAPAPHVRYSSMDDALEAADWSGGYLYLR